MPHPAHVAQPQPFLGGYPGEVCPPARARSLEIDKIFWEIKQAPDHSHGISADQRRLFIVGQRCISFISVVASVETATDGPGPDR
jgi:hypothetical protein